MMETRARLLTGLLILTGFQAAAGIAQQATPESAAAIAGDWRLNESLSDDPREQMRAWRSGLPRAGGGQRLDRDEQRRRTEKVLRAVQEFVVVQQDTAIVISYAEGEVVFLSDGRKHKVELDAGVKLEYKAWWESGVFCIERRPDGGGTAAERYQVQPETGRLHVLTRFEDDGLPAPLQFVRVYDRRTGSG